MDFRDDVEELLDEFDFDKVHQVMQYLNWTWVSERHGGEVGESEVAVPSRAAIRKHARSSLLEAAKRAYGGDEYHSSICGGFMVRAEWDKEKEKMYLRLSFELESMDNYYD